LVTEDRSAGRGGLFRNANADKAFNLMTEDTQVGRVRLYVIEHTLFLAASLAAACSAGL
jgi:hypothetical protein